MQLGLPASWNVTAGLPIFQLALSYNDANQVTTTSATAGPASSSFTSIYDGTNGSLQGLSSGGSGGSPNLASLAYNEYAQIAGITTLGGSSTQIASVQYSYDANLRPTTLTANWLPGSGNSGEILGQTRGYDNAGNVTSVSGFFASVPGHSSSGGTESQNFCYDEQNRLVWSGNGGTQPGAGNGTCGTGTLGNTLSGAGYTAPYQYTNLGQIWQGPLNGQGTNQQYLYCDSSHPHQLSGLYPLGTTCANRSGAVYTAGYDAWGNETSRSTNGVTATLSSDALNRLVEYHAGSNGQEWYLYNATGERVLKRSVSGSTTTLTVYAFGLQELSYSGSGAFASQIGYYALAGHLIGSTNGTITTYSLTDAQGSVLTTLSASAIVGQQVYGPYGNTRYQVGSMGTTKGYTGQFHDAVSGLDYYHARYDDPVVALFLTVDNVQGNMLGYDPYAYVLGNPETMNDPTGLWSWANTFEAIGAAIAVGALVTVAVVAAPVIVAVGTVALTRAAVDIVAVGTAAAGAAIDAGVTAGVGSLVGEVGLLTVTKKVELSYVIMNYPYRFSRSKKLANRSFSCYTLFKRQMFMEGEKMRTSRARQPLTYDVRLPDEAQADALRLLDATREVCNQALEMLWPHLDEFGERATGPAWKQVGMYIGSPQPHGDRQWRCESEVVGRLLRQQAERKKAFALVAPILSDGFIRPKTENRPAGKNRSVIKEAITPLQKSLDEDDTSFVTLQNVSEQCCNFFFQQDRFPTSYEELQAVPRLHVGMLTYAGDDGGEKGQAYRLALDLEAGVARFRFRSPDGDGVWHWRKVDTIIPLPACLKERLPHGELLAPTLREERRADGVRFAVLDFIVEVEKEALPAWEQVERVLGADWGVHSLLTATAVDEHSQQVGRPFFLDTGGFDGHQARTRRQIDELKKKVARYEQERDALAPDHPKRAWYQERLALYRREIARCWRKYEQRNRTLAHLASNVLLLLARVHGCSLLSMESLKTLKTTGRGRGVRGRWRNYCNNATIRGEIWRLLRYKCHLVGLRFQTCPPQGTSHTCPHCGVAAKTYRSPDQRSKAVSWGRWMWCEVCGFNGDRDYCASLNIARLGVAYVLQRKHTGKARSCSITDPRVKPVSSTGTGAVLLLPPPSFQARPPRAGKMCYYPGWYGSAFLQSSQPKAVFLRLCG